MFRSLMSWVSIVVGFGLLIAPAVQAQSLEEGPPAGSRVRVTLAGETDPARTGPRLVGRLAETRPGSIMLATSGSETRELRRDAIVRLERSVRPSRKKRGALIGYGVAFAAFGATAAALGSGGPCYELGASECVAAAAIIALPAAGIGALVAPGEQWADVPLGVRDRAPGARSAGLHLRVVPLVGPRSGLAVAASF